MEDKIRLLIYSYLSTNDQLTKIANLSRDEREGLVALNYEEDSNRYLHVTIPKELK